MYLASWENQDISVAHQRWASTEWLVFPWTFQHKMLLIDLSWFEPQFLFIGKLWNSFLIQISEFRKGFIYRHQQQWNVCHYGHWVGDIQKTSSCLRWQTQTEAVVDRGLLSYKICVTKWKSILGIFVLFVVIIAPVIVKVKVWLHNSCRFVLAPVIVKVQVLFSMFSTSSN